MSTSRPYAACETCGSLELCSHVPSAPTGQPRPLRATLRPGDIDPLRAQREAKARAAARRERAQAGYRWMPPADERLTIPTPAHKED